MGWGIQILVFILCTPSTYVAARHLVLLKHQALRKALFSMQVGNTVRRCQTSPPCARAFAQVLLIVVERC